MSDEFRKLQERNARIIEVIKKKRQLIADTQSDMAELEAERQANELQIKALSYEGDHERS